MGQIVVQGRVVLVDDEDVALLLEWQWHLHKGVNTLYVRGYPKGNRKGGLQYLHRVVMRAKRREEIDHRKGDGLDNRKAMLRRATRSQNNANSVSDGPLPKGVYLCGHTGRFRATVQLDGKRYRLGRFDTAQEAHAAYAAKAAELFGDFFRPS